MNEELYFKKSEPKVETWTKTMDLRFRIVEKRVMESNSAFFGNATMTKTIQDKILQQKHISNLGNEKWVDIETFVE